MTTEEKLQNFYNHSLDSANREAERVIGDHQKALDKIFEEHKATARRQAEEEVAAETEKAKRDVNKTLSKKEIDLAVSDAAKEYMTEEGYDEVMGVRPLRRVVEQQIRDKVTDFHLDNLDAKHLEADMEDGVLVIKEKDAK